MSATRHSKSMVVSFIERLTTIWCIISIEFPFIITTFSLASLTFFAFTISRLKMDLEHPVSNNAFIFLPLTYTQRVGGFKFCGKPLAQKRVAPLPCFLSSYTFYSSAGPGDCQFHTQSTSSCQFLRYNFD